MRPLAFSLLKVIWIPGTFSEGNMRNPAQVFFWACFPESAGGGKAGAQELLLVPSAIYPCELLEIFAYWDFS